MSVAKNPLKAIIFVERTESKVKDFVSEVKSYSLGPGLSIIIHIVAI